MHKLRLTRFAVVVALLLGCVAGASGQVVISGTLPNTDVGASVLSYGSTQLVGGGTPPYSWTVVTGPSLGWLSLNPDGSVTAVALHRRLGRLTSASK